MAKKIRLRRANYVEGRKWDIEHKHAGKQETSLKNIHEDKI